MKKDGLPLLVAVTLTVASIVLVAPASAQTCGPPPSDLVSWWPGEGTADDVTNQNHGTAENGTTYGSGKVGQAFHFDGVDDFVNVADSATLDAITTEITVDFWMKPDPEQRWERNMWVFARRDPLVSEGFGVLITPDEKLVVVFGAGSSLDRGITTIYQSEPIIRFGEWQHVAVAANTALGQVDAYVDGNPIPLQLVWGPAVSGRLFNVNHLFIGRRQGLDANEGEALASHYAGQVDEIHVFSRSLSAAEIQALYAAGAAGCEIPMISGAAASPALLWPPNHKTVNVVIQYTATDDSGSVECALGPVTSNEALDPSDWAVLDAHHVRLRAERTGAGIGRLYTVPITCVDPVGNTASEPVVVSVPHDKNSTRCVPPPDGLTGWWPGDGNAKDVVGGRDGALRGDARTGAGLVDRAFVLDGDGDFVDIPHDPALNLGTGDFTLDLWAFFDDTTGEQILAEKWVQSFTPGLTEGWTLTKLPDGVLLLAMAERESDWGVASGPLAIPTGVWTHFAATRENGKVTLFMNGVVVAEGETLLNLDSASSLKLGHRGGPSDTPGSDDDSGFFLKGRIDEAELLVGRALPASSIRRIAAAGAAGKCKN